ncbi:MAG TPA: alanine--tRNA ligase [Deltaproteobacteria bacterium]|nr:alanine--tRNA ligase [Deltaproteobacteria bacterium]
MKGSEIRELFLRYFQEKGHIIVPSSSLVPADDPSLLFTNAGMVQFKATFLGTEKREYSRATSSQKCVRAGGKHNDLENVGRTARHHTFFEMLGNFSFGDYFKAGAIEYAWDLLVHRMGLDPDKLWVSVHHDDDEAYEIWKRDMQVPQDRIIRLGDKDNFWAMGETGPCGPCSEIIYDQGPTVGCLRPECRIGECECDRYLEIWNLVFMQFDRDESGKLRPLPAPNIDTGMGLERITAVLQGVQSNYETDLFMPLLSFIGKLSGTRYASDSETDVSMRVVADHARAAAFLVGDGVLPSNEGRGYVLRRIIRRAARHGKLLGMDNAFLHKVATEITAQMGTVYPELILRKDFIGKVIANEEERFLKTLDRGLSLLDEIIDDLKTREGKQIPGREVFVLYDTFGFPVDLTEDIAAKAGLGIDHDGFASEMDIQREKARGSSTFGGAAGEEQHLGSFSGKVAFVGYDTFETESQVIDLMKRSSGGKTVPVDAVEEGSEAFLVTEITPFYGESGGQVGDSGTVESTEGTADVLDTVKTEDGGIVHRIRVVTGKIQKGQGVTLRVDRGRRLSIMRHHSATHLLQRVLRDVLGDHAHQSGSLVSDARLRFDFTHFAPMTDEEIDRVEAIVNQYVLEDMPIHTETTSKDVALKKGAMALFSEKYGDEVRMVTMGNDVSVELCGGTHCLSTGEIGLVKILNESSVSAGLRRIEAIAGTKTLDHIRSLERIVSSLSEKIKCAPVELGDRVNTLLVRIREQENTIKELNVKIATGNSSSDEQTFSTPLGTVVIKSVGAVDVAQMRDVGDRIKEQISTGVVLLFSPGHDKATFIAMATADLEKRFDAGKFMKHAMDTVGGRGGGKSLFAQGGAELSSVERVVELFKESSGVTQSGAGQ